VKHRLERVNELLKRELSSLITRTLTFEGSLVTINHVDVTPDLKSAHVFVSVLGSAGKAAVMEKLESHRAELQADMSKHVVLKYTPHLVFHLDDSIERGTRVIQILEELEQPESGEK
jgi:ribosome-binding factor A